jgi:hypothetical protein
MINHENNRVVARTGIALRTEVTTNTHALVADEPVSAGARTQGPRLTMTCVPRSGRAPR